MSKLPTLTTDRLVLRAFTLDDAPRVQALAGRMEIARTTLTIPHPYEDGMAEEWISTHAQDLRIRAQLIICLRDTLPITRFPCPIEHRRGNRLLGVGSIRHGYAPRSQAVMQYGFKEPVLERIYGFYQQQPSVR